jgi:hypothetical protein
VSRQWLTDQVVDGPWQEVHRARILEQTRAVLLSFTARGYFKQVVQQRHHHRCYQKWQETFQIEQLVREVSDEVSDMHSYLHMRKTEHIEQLQEESQRLERRLNVLAGLFLVPALILAYFDAVGDVDKYTVGMWFLAGVLAGAGLVVFLEGRWIKMRLRSLLQNRREAATFQRSNRS